ncbi:H-NS family nucleoid-associated regulatory protein [Paraburkholderia sp. 40]|uniref:H-NS family nucleoid-associated regulatory protein n=1 Tax=Paraburkholderia sp. 40 TaxID=2991059 RepID=UPI003D2184BB
MATLEQIKAKMAKLQAEAEALASKKSATVLKTIHELMEKHGLTTADIEAHTGGKKRGPKPGAKASPKARSSVPRYRDPKSGATWTGHGRAPSWIAAAKNRDKFLIDGSTATAKPAAASKAKAAGAYVRGPQPAMYQDQKSGATWSGRGRAPAWLAGAKDRSKFLIAGGVEAPVATNAAAVSKTKVAVKKAPKEVGATSTKGQPKGPQPAKYRDPKSGATWSGRGPAPAWLAGAKDRAKFLIASVSGVADSGAASKPKVVAKKPATKAAAAKKAPAKNLVGAKKVDATTNVAAAPEAAAA